MSDDSPDTIWESGWTGHRLMQQRRLATLPLAERIAWLEEAQKVADSLKQSTQLAKAARGKAEPPSA